MRCNILKYAMKTIKIAKKNLFYSWRFAHIATRYTAIIVKCLKIDYKHEMSNETAIFLNFFKMIDYMENTRNEI